MDERTTELRRDMESRRSNIGHTVDEIENRVHPGHVAARTRYRVKTRMRDWKQSIMGSGSHESGMSSLSDSMSNAPDAMRRQTRGNPLAAGVIAAGAGAVIASMLPPSDIERRVASEVEPQIESAVSDAREKGEELAHDAKETAKEGMDSLGEAARTSGEELIEEAKSAARQKSD